MVWFRVDDNFADHPKVRRIPRPQRAAAIGLWTLAGTWASRHLRDGKVPGYMVEELCAKPASAAALVKVGLWHEHGHDCGQCPSVDPDSFVFHDWTSLQFTRQQVEEKREADAERQRLARERKKAEKLAQEQQSQDRHAVTDSDEAVSHAPVHVSQARPEPVPSPSSLSSVEGERLVTLRAVPATDPPDEHCTKHPDGNPRDEPCGGCRRIRERRDRRQEAAADREARAKEARARDCRRCDGVWLLDADENMTGRKCDHRAVSA